MKTDMITINANPPDTLNHLTAAAVVYMYASYRDWYTAHAKGFVMQTVKCTKRFALTVHTSSIKHCWNITMNCLLT